MLRSPSRRLCWILFFVPWLVLLAVPALRWQFRVQAIGSEYAEDHISSFPVTLPAFWFFPRNLAPTWKQLQPQARRSADWRTAVDLKAPRQRGDDDIEAAEIYLVSGQALKRQPNDAYLLAVRLKAALAFVKDNRLQKEVAQFLNQPVYPAGSRAISRAGSRVGSPAVPPPPPVPPPTPATMPNSNLWEDYEDEKNFPAAARRIWWTREDQEFNPKVDAPRVSGPTKIAASEALRAALQTAQRGAALEPDNAYWPWQQSYLLLLLRQDAQAEKMLLRAANLKRYDDHRVEDFAQTLRVAQAHRPLLIEEKLSLQSRRSYHDQAFPKREDLWLLQARRTERRGDVQRNLTLSAALATIGALRLQIARNHSERRYCLLLQCVAWQGGRRLVSYRSVKNKKTTVIQYEIGNLNFLNWYNSGAESATPDMFARRFAREAQRAGRKDLAQAAIRQGQMARREAKRIGRHSYSHLANRSGEFRFAPALPKVFGLHWAAQMTLIQLQISLALWCLLNLLLWRRLWFLGRYAARGWRVLSMIWRTRDRPLWDEEVPVLEQEKHDGRRSFWFVGLWFLAASFGTSYWNLPLSEWYPEIFREDYEKVINIVPAVISLLLYPTAPVLFGLFWCGSAALKRYYRLQLPKVWRDDIETTAMHAPPSLIPVASAFMVWSVTVLAVLCWLGCLLSYYLPRGAFDFRLPSLWALWLDMPTFSLFSRPEEWAIIGTLALLATLAAWLWKWSWQLHVRRRLPALYLGLNWWRQTLGAWLLVGSWLYLALLLLALPARREADMQFERTLQNAVVKSSVPHNATAMLKSSTSVAPVAF